MLDRGLVKKVMASVLEVDEASLNDDSSMDNVPGWDSLKQMNLVLALEESFGVSIPDEDAGNATSYKLLALVLEEQLAG
ncbi:MAG: acyl carrier protein [Burkholderiaceae bacterium]|uniref:Acyl carrier protein n=1 Tax=Roseateles toxinivorans TaxID=270368 RepID=A0A4R6QPA5_9BURK|nr:phosphopantetheine-binding protein [Roseateles toxinivorans]MBT9459532.1 acyl carrier protein [Burkholderiaceae bacterium]MBT9501397.1 acyl carrier protein [Burkholderiaceae bacterium]TDP64331.1 acyl carrier protein [Roseateles toxinivorans]